MRTAAEATYASEVAPSTDSPLLAVRRAAWPFERALLRSIRFNQLLDELARMEPEISRVAGALVDRVYHAIPKAAPESRGSLLTLKRAIFNHRPLPRTREGALFAEDESSAALLSRYAELVERRDSIVVGNTGPVLQELRECLAEYLSRRDFRLAIEASSPTLFGAISRDEASAHVLSDRTCRSLYAYICRFSTKANPLHLFSYLILGPAMGGPAAGCSRGSVTCEVVFHVQDILSIEQRLLAGAVDRSRVRLALAPLLRKGSGWEVWVKRDNKWCTAFLPDQPVLARLREVYDSRCERGLVPSLTRPDLERELASEGCSSDLELVSRAVDKLVEQGVLIAYLLEDLRAPGPALRDLDESTTDQVACLDRWHVAAVDGDALPILGRELAGARSDKPRAELRYYVNSYAHDDVDAADLAAREVARPLAELKPVLTVTNNFARQNRVILEFFRRELPDGVVRPYTDLLATFFRRRIEILDDLEWGQEPPECESFSRRCQAHDHQLDTAALRTLVSVAPAAARDPVCFVGPFDFVSRRFYLTNLFAGDQRSIARFLLARRRCDGAAAATDRDPDTLDVELAVPPVDNLTFVTKRFDVGCGFEGRWARGYRQWLDPVRIDVAVRDRMPIYIDRPTGRRLRFQYVGLLQAQFLPIEYQLLLVEHADNYRNPFAAVWAADADVEHRPALHYGPVCLRREAWCAPTSSILRLLHKRDLLSATVAVRRWVWERLAPEDLWFYRFPSYGSPAAQKPRLLDLLSPLSVMALRRDLAHDTSHIVLCRMEPDPTGLWQSGGELYAAELMVEA